MSSFTPGGGGALPWREAGSNGDEVGNGSGLKAISVPLMFGLSERDGPSRGDTLLTDASRYHMSRVSFIPPARPASGRMLRVALEGLSSRFAPGDRAAPNIGFEKGVELDSFSPWLSRRKHLHKLRHPPANV